MDEQVDNKPDSITTIAGFTNEEINEAATSSLLVGILLGVVASAAIKFCSEGLAPLVAIALVGAFIIFTVWNDWRLKTILAVMFLVAVPSASQAGNCNQFFYPQKVVAVPVFAAPVYYQAGRDIEAEAFAEKVARLVEPRVIEKLGGEQFKADLATSRSQAKTEQLAKPNKTAIAEHCAKCHSGAAPKGGIVLDGDTPINGEQLGDSLTALSDDSMPKDHKLSPEVKGKLMAELLALEKRGRPAN